MILAALLALPLSAAVFEAPEPLASASATPLEAPRLPLCAIPQTILPVAQAAAPLLPASALGQAHLAMPNQGPDASRRPAEAQGAELAHAFDGVLNAAPGAVPAFLAPASPVAGGWAVGTFESASGGKIAYKTKDGSRAKPARVYAGGLGLNESFDTYFQAQPKKLGAQYFMWTRGHPPTEWSPARHPIDADARDLARMIIKAGESTKTGRVEVALHSYGTLVFQRMAQLRGEPEIDRALAMLSNSRVFLLNATTHYEGSERRAGPEMEQMGTATRQFVDWLDAMDEAAEAWRAAARLNPLLIPQAQAYLAIWGAQRRSAISMAASQAASMQKKDLEEPWPEPYDDVRGQLVAALKKDSHDAGWQEALLRRSADMFRLDFTKKDAAFLRRAKIRLELVHSAGDKLLSWESSRALLDELGIDSPEKLPPIGSILTDRTGLFRVRVVDGDHYFPLKKPAGLSEVMDR